MNPRTTSPRHRPQLSRRRLVAGGLALTTLGLAGTAAAAVAAPDSPEGQAAVSESGAGIVEWDDPAEAGAAGAAEAESADPDPGFTEEQLNAFWGAGYTGADADALAALWQTDLAGVKARAGQMILDGQNPPIAPGTTKDVGAEQVAAFYRAGFTNADADALAALWQTDYAGVKARAGQMILDGQTPPIAPGTNPDPDEGWGYTPAQLNALFYGAGYTWDDVEALVALWQTDYAGVKARAGQMIIDGQTLPIAPGSSVAGS